MFSEVQVRPLIERNNTLIEQGDDVLVSIEVPGARGHPDLEVSGVNQNDVLDAAGASKSVFHAPAADPPPGACRASSPILCDLGVTTRRNLLGVIPVNVPSGDVTAVRTTFEVVAHGGITSSVRAGGHGAPAADLRPRPGGE